MSVNDDAELPWLTAEKRLIGEAVRAGVPYFGACLGVQLLAASLGARVYAGPEPEVGVLPVTLTAEGAADPIFAGLPRDASRRCSGTATRSTCPTGRRCWRPRRPTRTRRSGTAGSPTASSSTSRCCRRWRASGRRCPSTSATPTGCSAPAGWSGCCAEFDAAEAGDAGDRAQPCSRAGRSLPSPSPDSRFLALRFAAQDATDFGMSDDRRAALHRAARRRRGRGRDRRAASRSTPEVAAALVKADGAQALAHRIAAGDEPMYPLARPRRPGGRRARRLRRGCRSACS